MRPLLPLFCGLVAGFVLSSVSLAEDTFVIKSVTVETRAAPAQPPVTPEKAMAVLNTAGAETVAAELAPVADPDEKKADILRGSLFMMILPNLCCRY